MSRVAVLFSALLSAGGCGGATERDGGNAVSAGGSSIEVIDDMDNTDGQYPSVPPGSTAFFWRGGLGNWFVTTSDGVMHDAAIDEVVPAQPEGDKACHASGSGDGVGVDLWAQLDHPQGRAVDVGDYAGIAFSARLSGVNSALIVAFGASGRFFVDAAGVAQQTLVVSNEWNTSSCGSTKPVSKLPPPPASISS
jgi:hypothetical protein